MHNRHPCKLVVIITEAELEDALAREVMEHGAHGYTVSDVRGAGTHGPRSGLWAADRSIRMEILCDDDTAGEIVEHVEMRYFNNFAMVVYVAEVGVLRLAKFSRREG